MKSLLVVMLVSLSFTAQAGLFENREFRNYAKKAEPMPKDRDDRSGNQGGDDTPGSREETYEGNERDGGSFDGGGYDDGSDGGMIGELFSTPMPNQTIKTVTEDRGAVIVYTTTRLRGATPADTCTYITVQIVEKKTGALLASDTINSCDNQVL